MKSFVNKRKIWLYLVIVMLVLMGSPGERKAAAKFGGGFVEPTTEMNFSEYSTEVKNLTNGKKITFQPGNGKYMLLALGRPTICRNTQIAMELMEELMEAVDLNRVDLVFMNADSDYSDEAVKTYLTKAGIHSLPVINIVDSRLFSALYIDVYAAARKDGLPSLFPDILFLNPEGDVVKYTSKETRGYVLHQLLVNECGSDIILKTKKAENIVSKYVKKEQELEKIWNLIQNYADPDYFLTKSYANNFRHEILTEQQKNTLKSEAVQAVVDCHTDYEKIESIVQMVANRTYYDYPYYTHQVRKTYDNPYEVWTQKRAVCQGYAYLTAEFFYSLKIPCMLLYGDNHVFNAVYDREKHKWIFCDATWASGNMVTKEGKWEEGEYDGTKFDISMENLKNMESHEMCNSVGGLLYENIYYQRNIATLISTRKDGSTEYADEWTMEAVRVKDKKVACKKVKKVAGIDTEYHYYTIRYSLSGGNNNSKNPKKYSMADDITLKAPKKKGYFFLGWYSDAGYTKKVTGITRGSTGLKVFYAKWKKK